jgi:hypothetical protein
VPPDAWLLVASVPALVCHALCDQLQAKVAHTQAGARRHHTAHSYLLRTLGRCGVCRLACTARTLNHRHA